MNENYEDVMDKIRCVVDFEEYPEDYTEWKTKSGKIMKITDMSTSHIRNAIKMSKRNLEKLKEDIETCDGNIFESIGFAVYSTSFLEQENHILKYIEVLEKELHKRHPEEKPLTIEERVSRLEQRLANLLDIIE